MNRPSFPRDFFKLLKSVKGKRARTVIDHILDKGQITTEELKELYGYNHPPRAARDVREQGIPLETTTVIGSDGKKIAAYRFGDPADARTDTLTGRTTFSKALKMKLIARHGSRCNIYQEEFPDHELQIDHRVPFAIGGEGGDRDDCEAYMLLCPSANRAKSWSCEHCPNWELKDSHTCRSCYWAFPETYSHVAMRDIRRLEILWSSDELIDHARLQKAAQDQGTTMPSYVKSVLKKHFSAMKGADRPRRRG